MNFVSGKPSTERGRKVHELPACAIFGEDYGDGAEGQFVENPPAHNLTLEDIARQANPVLRGWFAYFTVFYPSRVIPLCRRIDRILMRWARKKCKRLKRSNRRAKNWLRRVRDSAPRLFAHWMLRY